MDPEIFTQAFIARIVPSAHEVVLPAIRNFHFEHYPQAATLAAVGALSASVILFLVGVLVRRWPERVSTEEKRVQMESVRAKGQNIVQWLLVFAPLPVGGIIIIAAGFFRIKPLKVAAILVGVEAIYRAMPYLHN